MGKIMVGIATFLLLFSLISPATALAGDIVQGQAAIENGDTARARENARKDAMRSYVENKMGVHVTSETETAQNMVVRDEILAKSDGYVQVDRVIKEWQADGLYFMQLELEANMQKIQTMPSDLRSRLEAMAEDSSRSGIVVAVTGQMSGSGNLGKDFLTCYLKDKLENIGFRAVANEAVTEYLIQHSKDPDAGVQARTIARNYRENENALLRGSLQLVSDERLTDGYHKVTVGAAFELVGLDSNEVNNLGKYFTAVAASSDAARQQAESMAIQEAVEVLGQKALKTVQEEYRGGVKHLKIMARFAGISDPAGQRQQILSALAAANCHVIRTALKQGGILQVYLSSDSYGSIEDIRSAILSRIGVQVAAEHENEAGSQKLEFSF